MSKFNRQLVTIGNLTGYKSPALQAATTLFESSISSLNRAKSLGDLSLSDKGALVDRVNSSYEKLKDSLVGELTAIEDSLIATERAIESKLTLNTQQQQLIGLLATKSRSEIMKLAESDPSIAVMACSAGSLVGLGQKDKHDLLKTIAPDELEHKAYLERVQTELGDAAHTLTREDGLTVSTMQLSQSEREQLQIINQSVL